MSWIKGVIDPRGISPVHRQNWPQHYHTKPQIDSFLMMYLDAHYYMQTPPSVNIFPLCWFVHHIHAKNVFNYLIYPLNLSIYLWMIGCTGIFFGTRVFKKDLPKVGCKLGNSCNINISLMNMLEISIVLWVDLIGIKCVDLDKLSTTTMIESCFLEVGRNLVIKSIVTTSHF